MHREPYHNLLSSNRYAKEQAGNYESGQSFKHVDSRRSGSGDRKVPFKKGGISDCHVPYFFMFDYSLLLSLAFNKDRDCFFRVIQAMYTVLNDPAIPIIHAVSTRLAA